MDEAGCRPSYRKGRKSSRTEASSLRAKASGDHHGCGRWMSQPRLGMSLMFLAPEGEREREKRYNDGENYRNSVQETVDVEQPDVCVNLLPSI